MEASAKRSMNMASSSSSAMHFSEQTSYFSRQTESEMESSKTHHWTDVDYSRTSSEWSVESNFHHYDLLKKDPEMGRFFRDFPTLELGEKISEGGQADVYEARSTSHGVFNLVAKVMKGDAPLQAFQRQWPIGMLSAYKSEASYVPYLPLITILGGTLLEDERVKGRFAFIMHRRWGDLRLLIDRRMKHKRSTVGPFFMDQVIELMWRIAEDMEGLHTKHDIIHRDLKASNVLVWGELGANVHVVAPNENEKIGSVVADFECSVGVLGTGIWRAPEILKQVRARVPSSDWEFTRASDVYSYGMTCYEIVSGHLPFEGQWAFEVEEDVLDGVRPNLPVELPSYLRSIIEGCWISDPEMRPTFSDICKMLKNKQGYIPPNVVIDNGSDRNATIIEVEHWGILQPSTLLQALERLLRMQLWVSESKMSLRHSATVMTVQSFKVTEVTDGEGRMVRDEDIIAKIVKVLSLPVKIEWIVERSEVAGFTAEGSADADTTSESYLLYIKSRTGAWDSKRRRFSKILSREDIKIDDVRSWIPLLARILAILSGMNFQVYDVRCWNRKGLVECAFFAEGGQMDSLLPEILAKEAGREAVVDCEILLRKLPSRDDYLDLQNAYVEGTSFGQFLSHKLPATEVPVGEPYGVQIISQTGGPSLLRRISVILTEMKIQVHEVQFMSDIDHVECAVSVDARSMDAMLRHFLAKEAERETPDWIHIVFWIRYAGVVVYYDSSDWRASQFNVHMGLRSGKSSDLRAPQRPPAMRIHVGIDDSGFLPLRLICRPENLVDAENLVDVACSFPDSSILIERYEVPSYGGIEVPRGCMVEDTFFQDEDGETRTRFQAFVNRHFKFGWNIDEYRILHNDIQKTIKLKDYVDRYHIDGGKVELICKVGFGDLMRCLYVNGLRVSSIDDVAWPDYKKGLITSMLLERREFFEDSD